MVDFGESDKMIKIIISGEVDKSNTYNGINGNISFFITKELHQTKYFWSNLGNRKKNLQTQMIN